jgi:hypothetical protein
VVRILERELQDLSLPPNLIIPFQEPLPPNLIIPFQKTLPPNLIIPFQETTRFGEKGS